MLSEEQNGEILEEIESEKEDIEIETYDKGTYDFYIKFSIMCERYKSIRERR